MNALEDRLREALAERAAHCPIDPDAWDKTVARSRRRIRLARPARFPAGFAAAAAAVVAIVVTATAVTGGLTGGHSSPGQQSTRPRPRTIRLARSRRERTSLPSATSPR